MRPMGTGVKLAERRYQAVKLVEEEGWQAVEVANKFKVTPRAVSYWLSAYRKNGEEGLNPKPNEGRESFLTDKQKERLRNMILEGASAHGFPSDLWSCPRVASLIEEKFGISYHVDHIGRLLRKLGFSPQKPERRAKERNPEQVQYWIANDWPKIKKKRKKKGL